MNRSRDEREPPADGPRRVTPSSDGALDEKRFAVILGARSLVGRYLVRRLAVEGFTGWCLTRRPGPFPYVVLPGFYWRTMRDGERMSAPATATLFSLAPLSALPAIISRISGGGTLIALSSSGAALKAKSSDPEERRTADAQRRAEDKIRRICQDRKLVWTLFRPALIYDPGRDRNVSVIADFIRRFGAFPVVWPGLGYRPPIHADDVANTMANALNAPRARETLFELPLAYEVMPGNTSDNTTLAGFLEKIENQYGRSDRVWVMDRGIPTEATLATMREDDAPVHYLVGTPKGRLTKLEKSFLGQPWQAVRPCVEVKLLAEEGELYVLVHSESRVLKERSMRRRRLKKLWQRLHELRHQSNRRDQLLLKLGSAKKEAGRAWHLVDIRVPETGKPVTPETFTFALRRDRLRQARRREGRYLLRSNMTGEDPATLWKYYMRLTEIEQAFKELKHDLAIRPIFHQREERIEAHIFVSFLAYCLLVTLKNLARPRAPGLTARAILEKFSTIQMVDVHLPTTDGRRLVLPRHTRPSHDHELLLHQLGLKLPEQPAPRLSV